MDALCLFSVKKRFGLAACFGAGLGLLALFAPAKQGVCQKAEPRALQFKRIKRGVYAAKVSKQTVKGYEEAEYAFNARKTQRCAISINAAPPGSVYPRLYGPQGVPAVELRQADKTTWTVALPRDSEYLLTISRTQKAAGPSRYAFTVTLR